MNLYPLKLTTITIPKIWGMEVWHLAQMNDYLSVVENGYLADNDLGELVEVYMGELVGEHVYEQFGNTFPLLFKIINTEEDLSIQVHPDNDSAFGHHQCMGKSEMWYVMDAQEESSIIAGFKQDTDAIQVRTAIEQGRLTELLNTIPVKTGDVAYIPSGRVHALNKHLTIAEIQQNSDLTYRLFDYNRQPINGPARQLHVEESLKVLDYTHLKQPLTDYSPVTNGAINLVSSDYFLTNLLCFDRKIIRDYVALDSFVVYMCVAGDTEITADGVSVSIKKGDTLLIPASTDEVTLRPITSQEVRLLEVYLP